MSATPPSDPKDAAKKELNNALLWTALAAAFAVGMFVYAGKVEVERRNFYLIAGAVCAILTAVNGYGAWGLSQKVKK